MPRIPSYIPHLIIFIPSSIPHFLFFSNIFLFCFYFLYPTVSIHSRDLLPHILCSSHAPHRSKPLRAYSDTSTLCTQHCCPSPSRRHPLGHHPRRLWLIHVAYADAQETLRGDVTTTSGLIRSVTTRFPHPSLPLANSDRLSSSMTTHWC